MQNSYNVQNNMLIKIELYNIDNLYTTGARLSGYSLCSQFLFTNVN